MYIYIKMYSYIHIYTKAEEEKVKHMHRFKDRICVIQQR